MFRPLLVAVLALAACGSSEKGSLPDGGLVDLATVSPGDAAGCATRPACAAVWEANAAAKLAAANLAGGDLTSFLAAMPKGADLHNHLTGAVYAETYLGWAKTDGDCIDGSLSAVYSSSCGSSTQATPVSGSSLYDQLVDAWSMKDFVAGAQSGHDHFFATFGKFGAVPGAHRDSTIADVLTRAASENVVYVETMFNLGKQVGSLASSVWTSSTLTTADIPTLYSMLSSNSGFASQVSSDVATVQSAATGYQATLGCSGANPPAACNVKVRYIAQVSRTGNPTTVFGQLVSAFEMAVQSPQIVAANLSSPEDDSTSLTNYDLHMAMLDFLHGQYAQKSPLHVTLHAGELVPQYLPAAFPTANTYHVRAAVETGHAERIGHGVDIESEMDPDGLMDEMAQKGVAVEVCLSSNAQILQVSGTAHPLAKYLAHGVPVALATDDQGVSRSSLAGEYARAVTDQMLDYKTLKAISRASLEHSFLPGASLWSSPGMAVSDCAPADNMALGDSPSTACQAFLNGSEKARTQWELERRFLAFESAQ
jgi:adenosine deaminase